MCLIEGGVKSWIGLIQLEIGLYLHYCALVVALSFLIVWELTDVNTLLLIFLCLKVAISNAIGCLTLSLAYMIYFKFAIVLLPLLLQKSLVIPATWAGLAATSVGLLRR